MNPFSSRSMLKSIVNSMAKRDPEALELLIELIGHPFGLDPYSKLVKSGLVGTQLHTLWDICDRDIEKVIFILENCPHRHLVDSCSGSAHWGRHRLAKYLDNPAWDVSKENKN